LPYSNVGITPIATPGRMRHPISVQVFIVDDSPLVRQRLAELLIEVDNVHVIGQAGTVADALIAIPLAHPDFVMLDARMPDGDGMSVLAALKRLHEPPLVGMLTNYPSEPYRKRCLSLGADYFWDKSKDLAEIPAAFRALARRPGRS
jgi:DNA-binding NarL/FixJ family response regulator